MCNSLRVAYVVIKISCTFAAVCPFTACSNGLNLVSQVPDALSLTSRVIRSISVIVSETFSFCEVLKYFQF